MEHKPSRIIIGLEERAFLANKAGLREGERGLSECWEPSWSDVRLPSRTKLGEPVRQPDYIGLKRKTQGHIARRKGDKRALSL